MPFLSVILWDAKHQRRISRIFKVQDSVLLPSAGYRMTIAENDPLKNDSKRGFTLIEMSIVLVIIGLVVGGILVGRDLIKASEARATVTQVERFNSAVNTFFGKFSFLPGDIKDPDASTFGFVARGSLPGEGDGNGVLDGIDLPVGTVDGTVQSAGENSVFWVDLSTAHLIEGNFSTAKPNSNPSGSVTGTALNNWLPVAKLGQGNYFYVYSGNGANPNSINYFGLSATTQIALGGTVVSTPALTVKQAYDIDTKIDDGLPTTGRVLARYIPGAGGIGWAAGGGVNGISPGNPAAASATSCYDNGGNASAVMKYSVTQNNGAGVNCALSFQIQGGD